MEPLRLLYASNLTAFTAFLAKKAADILRQNVGVTATPKSFHFNGYRYPLRVVLYESTSTLGYFNSDLYEIGINIALRKSEEKAVYVLMHELAHYLCFLECKDLSHGSAFKEICNRYHFPVEVSKSSMNMDLTSVHKRNRLQEKIDKLFRLSSSPSESEAKLALQKAKELLDKHEVNIPLDHESIAYLERPLPGAKRSTKLEVIADIVRQYNVESILHKGKKVYLEIIGSMHDVEVASYIARYLDTTLEKLWSIAKQEHQLKGQVAKASYFRGLSQGFCTPSITALSKEKALITSKHLMKLKALVYPKLSYSKRGVKRDTKSFTVGLKEGENLFIPTAVKGKSMLSKLLSFKSNH